MSKDIKKESKGKKPQAKTAAPMDAAAPGFARGGAIKFGIPGGPKKKGK